MIIESANVTMLDGSMTRAMEVYVGKDVFSFVHARKPARATVRGKKVEPSTEIIGLMLSNGQHFFGSRNQRVAVVHNKSVRFRPLCDIMLGDKLRGERAGMPVNVEVSGLVFNDHKEMRLVEFELDHDKPFVAQGILCR